MTELQGARRVSATVPLRRYRLISRACGLDVDPDDLVLLLPGVFGAKRLWRLPLDSVGVVASGRAREVSQDPQRQRVFVDPVTIAYLATTTPIAPPNLELLFKAPERLPPITLRGAFNVFLPYLASRSAAGAWVDGVALRARDPQGAVAALVRAGAEEVASPTRWLTEHRRTSTDPAQVARVEAADRRAAWAPRLSTALFMLFLVTSAWARHAGSWLAAGASVVEVGLAVAAPGMLRRGRWRR